MFERYTDAAKRVVFFSRYEASSYGSRSIEPEHLLLGLIRAHPSLLKERLSIDPVAALRREIEPSLKSGPRFETPVEMPLSEGAIRVLEHASAEAERLSHQQVGTEHLLLAILQEEKCHASRVLRLHGLTAFEPREEHAQ